jgi:TatA/E family protein of Tat protein translocase
MGALEPGHLIVVLVIILIIFGPGKLPQLGKAIGESVRELKRASTDEGHAKPSTGSPGSGAPGSRRCPACGAAVRGDALFCGGCGTRLTSEAGAPITGSAPAATRGERE